MSQGTTVVKHSARSAPAGELSSSVLSPTAGVTLQQKDFKFRFKRLPNMDTIENGFCGCCFTTFRRSLPNGVSEYGLRPMVCYGCLKMCHRYCYGLSTATKTEKQVVYFVCDVCRSEARKQSLCQICGVDEGMLKEIEGFGFVHFICAITHQEINVVDYESLRFEVSINYQRTKQRCEICKADNAYFNCSEEQCTKSAHPYCVLTTFKKKEQEAEGGDIEDVWKYYISAGENKVFDVSHELPEKQWIQSQTASVFKRLQDFSVEKPDKQLILDTVYSDMVANHKPVSTLKRGGFQYILCPSHSKHNMYCVCMIQVEGEMVECECCLQWYHYSCGSYKNEEVYICPFCFEWFKLKEKIFEEIKSNKSDNYELRVLRPPKYNIPDFILYMIVADRRLQVSYDSTGSLGKLIKNLVYYYPLKTSKISLVIKELSERKIQQAADFFLQQYFKQQEPLLVLKPVLKAIGDGKIEVIQANVEHNQMVRQYINSARSFVLNGSSTPFNTLLEALNWKDEVAKIRTITIETQLNTLLSSSYPHPQLPLVQEKLDQLKLKTQITQAQNTFATLAEVESLRDSAQRIGMTIEAETLNKRSESARAILMEVESALNKGVDFDQFKQIEEKMKELNSLKVTPTINYWDNYKKQVTFINDLHAQLMKGPNRRQETCLADKVNTLENIELPKVSKELKETLKQIKNHSFFTNPKMQHVYVRFNRIVWDHEVTTMSKDSTTPQQLKVIYQEGLKLELPSYDENFLKVNTLHSQWQTRQQQLEQFFNESNMIKYLEDKVQLGELSTRIDQATSFYNDLPLNTKKELAAVIQKKQIVDFAMRLLDKLAEPSIRMPSVKELYREADSIKFPKSSQLYKKLNDLLMSNNLIQQQFATLQKKAQEKLDAFKAEQKWKKPRKEQIKSNSDKPSIRQAKALVDQMKASPVDYASQIETIEQYINISNEISEKTRQFMSSNILGEFQSKQFWDNIKKESEDLRKRILIEAPLSLTVEQIELYHFEIKSRIIMSFKGFIPSDLDKLTKLLKFADEQSIQLELGEWYGRLRTEVEQGTQLQRELDQLKNLEEQLNKEFNKSATAAPYTNLASLRRSMNLQPLKVSSSPLIIGIADRAKKFESKAASLRSQSKPSYQQVKNVYLEGLRIPVELTALQWLAQLVERSTQLHRRWTSLSGNTVQRLINEYDKLEVKIDSIENDKNNYLTDCKNLEDINIWVGQQNEGLTEFDISKAERIEELWESLGQTIRTSDKYESVRLKFLEYWVNLLKYPQPDLTISYLKAKGLLNELYDMLRRALTPAAPKDQLVKKLRQPIECLERMLESVVDLIVRINKSKLMDQVQSMPHSLEIIDITEIYYECKALLAEKRNVVIDIKIRRPYADLHRFYQDFDRVQSVYADEIPRQPEEKKKEESKEILKRPAVAPLTSKDIGEDTQQRKKLKREQSYQSSSTINQPSLQNQPSFQNQPSKQNKGVVEQDRKEIRDILARTIRKNAQYKEVNSEDHAKMIENQIFGDWHQNRKKYLEVSQNFEALFIRLQECPLLSSKVKRKNFEFLTLKGLVDNFHQIMDSEEKLRTKANKIKEEQHQQQEIQQQIEENKEEELEFKKQIDHIYELSRQREKQQKEKERERRERQRERERDRGYHGRQSHRQGRDRDRDRRQKKHNRDREREKRRQRDKSRSRSRDKKGEKQQLRFSEDEDTPQAPVNPSNQQLGGASGIPSYLQKQYNIRGAYTELDQGTLNQNKSEPVLFDPDEQENQSAKKEKQIPSGTVIKLKDCELDFLTRSHGKVVISGAMYTIEDVKRIKQFCDPNLEKIVIRKDKKQSDILQYLAKPSKKKYRNLVGWFEANNVEDNEHLKDLAWECEESKRIYGIQNDLVKVHILSSRQITKQLTSNRIIAPTKISSEAVAKHLDERRMVFVMQYFTEKLYEMRFTMKCFPYVALDTSYEVVQPVTSMQTDDYMSLYQRYSTETPPMMTPTTIAPSTPTGLGMMGTIGGQKTRGMSIPEQDYRQIEGWGMDVSVTIPDNPIKASNKTFSPIVSEDEGQELANTSMAAKKPAVATETKSAFDIRNFLKSLDPEAINKLKEDEVPMAQPPLPSAPFLNQPEMRAPLQQHPPSFVYQPAGRMQHQLPPPLVNSNPQRSMGNMQHMGMHMPPPISMPPYNSMGLPPPIAANRYSTIRPMPPGNSNPLPQPFYGSQNYQHQPMMNNMQPPAPPGNYDFMRNQPRPFMPPKDKKDEQKY